MNIGDILEVEITAIAHGGHCIARHDGRVIFVRHAIPGEKVRIEITNVTSKFARADAIEVLIASADRIAPRCEYAHPKGCGGCDFQHVSHARQRTLKSEIVQEQFHRIAKMDLKVEVEEVLPIEHWRTRVAFSVTQDRLAAFHSSRSDNLITISNCQISDKAIDIAAINKSRLPSKGRVNAVIDQSGAMEVIVEGRESRALISYEVLGRKHLVDPASFWQSHIKAPELLAGIVRDWCQARTGDHIFDLYGGVGLFTGALLDQVGNTGRITLIESDARAITDARRNFASDSIVEIVESQVERAISKYARADIVVVDPPRAGVGSKTLQRILALQPRTLVYVSCDPATLARDTRVALDNGYRLDQIRALDLFPMTHHIECVARFMRNN